MSMTTNDLVGLLREVAGSIDATNKGTLQSGLLLEAADRLALAEEVVKAARDTVDALGDMMNEHTPLGQHENGEIEYCSGSACAHAERSMATTRDALDAYDASTEGRG